MKNLARYQKTLKIIEKFGVKLAARIKDQALIIGQIKFRPQSDPAQFSTAIQNEGLLLQKSSKELRRSLQKKGVNYFDLNGNIFVNLDGKRFLIEEAKKRRPVKSKVTATHISPTNLVSPNGFAFIDVLFRIDEKEIESFPSTLQFCKHFGLYQPKASQIMSKISARSLLEAKKKIKNIPVEWWIYALDFPAAKRKMTCFFDIAQNYYSLDDSINKLPISELLSRLEAKSGNDVLPGPIEVAKSFGEILDNNFSVWISPDVATQIKKEFKLVPGAKEGHRKWLFASPPMSLRQAELVTHEIDPKLKTNTMRAIWDLGFGESRLQEARLNILQRFFK